MTTQKLHRRLLLMIIFSLSFSEAAQSHAPLRNTFAKPPVKRRVITPDGLLTQPWWPFAKKKTSRSIQSCPSTFWRWTPPAS
jgi:hypothetical protein